MSITAPLLVFVSGLLGLPNVAHTGAAAPNWGPAQPTQTQNERLRDVMEDSTGTHGFFVREIGGPIHAGYNSTKVFEPASSIKVLAHLYAMRRVDNGSPKLRDRIGIYESPDICHDSPTETLAKALQLMMQVSDNDRTRAVVDKMGRTNINNMAVNLGFGKLKWKRAMECEVADQNLGIENEMTLVDAGKLYEGVVRGKLLEKESSQRKFWELMAGHSHAQTIDEELAAAGLSSAAKEAYKARVRGASKGGSWMNEGRISDLGWVRLPHCVNGRVQNRDYVHGFFVDDGAPSNGNSGPVWDQLGKMRREIMREQIRTSVRTWSGCAEQPTYEDAGAPRPGKQATPTFEPV